MYSMGVTGVMLRITLLCCVLQVTALELHSSPNSTLTIPCVYDYEAHGRIDQLSLQWRSPKNQLLCHFIKHKSYRNCTQGYSVLYTPGNISLIITAVRDEDFGRHVCSVSKRHAFSDYTIDIVEKTEAWTPPADKEEHSGHAQEHLFLLGCSLILSVFGC